MINAHFMRGLGTGLIVAALLFIAWPSKEALTDEHIRERAGQLGMVDAKKQESVSPKTRTFANTPGEQKTAKAPDDQKAAKTPDQQSTNGEKPDNDTPAKSPVPESEAPTPNQTVTIVVPAGANSDDVADMLAEKGLIKDTKQFDQLVNRLGVESKFKIGTFNLHQGMDTTEIILELTGK